MPHYYFDVKNGHRLVDPSGLECKTDADATKQARVIAATIAEEAPASAGRRVAVLDDQRREITAIRVGEQTNGSEQAGGRQRAQGRGEEADPTQDQGSR
jgi:hypothetical protein